MKIEVTQEHIDKGGKHYTSCPVALAILDHFPEESMVSAGTFRIHVVCTDGTDLKYVTPSYVASFITDYDIGHTVVPFSFELGPI